jgi:hypothetical protein
MTKVQASAYNGLIFLSRGGLARMGAAAGVIGARKKENENALVGIRCKRQALGSENVRQLSDSRAFDYTAAEGDDGIPA